MYYKGEKMEKISPNTDLHGFGERIRQKLAARIPSDKKLKVLDVGTGFGMNVAFLAGHLSASSRIWTVDPSDEVLANVKSELGAKIAAKIEFLKASADDLDFDDGHFDFVVSVMVMHHVGDVRAVIEEMVRVTKPGGALLIVDYKPEASHALDFQTRHRAADFFKTEAIKKELERTGCTVKAKDFPLWYLVEATKPKG